ncbi:hypothetical protein TSUD_283920 [Trifolium subterraneum]|uniref:Endonuclease/exonuclease/phosphatase domain-containing protein n=1 Tax=Trifolium subterraneum TaxID=3900 RepID=A0A2Z6P6Y5_TRISU|nr:hypothetical protein TSUD_283920 [Trifolium subterraneum]
MEIANDNAHAKVSINTDPVSQNQSLEVAKHINPNVIAIDEQHVSFLIEDGYKGFGITADYASTNYITRRLLWSTLANLQHQPWCLVGDFNTILGSNEHREDFQNWTDNNNLIHIPMRGANFTWNNGRRVNQHTEKRLDREICNQSW